VKNSTQYQKALMRIATAVGESLALEEVLERALEAVAETTGLPVIFICLLDEEQQKLTLTAWRGMQKEDLEAIQCIPLGKGICGMVAQTGHPAVIEDINAAAGLDVEAARRLGLRTAIVVPMQVRGRVVGTMAMGGWEPRSFSPADVDFLTAIGDMVGVAVENARLHEQLSIQHIEEQEALLRLSQELQPLLDPQAIMDKAVHLAASILEADIATVWLCDPEENVLVLRSGVGFSPEMIGVARASLAERASGGAYALQTRQPVVITDTDIEERFAIPPFVREENIRSVVLVPMFHDEEAVGVMVIASRHPAAFADRHVRLLALIANQTAAALEQARLHQETSQRAEELAARQRVIQAILRTPNLNERLEVALDELMALSGADFGSIYLLHDERLILQVQRGMSPDKVESARERPLSQVPWAREPTIRRERPEESKGEIPLLAKEAGIQALLSLPMLLDDELVGLLFLGSRRYDAFPPPQICALKALVEQVAVAIREARLYTQARERLRRLTALRDIDRAIIAHLNLEEIIQVVLKKVPVALDAEAVALSLLDEEGHRSRVFQMRLPNGTIIGEEAFSLSDSLLMEMRETQRPVVIPDLTADPRLHLHRDLVHEFELHGYVGAPLIVRDRLVGILHILTIRPVHFLEEDVNFLATLAGQTAIALENARLFDEARRRAEALACMTDLGLRVARTEGQETLSSLLKGVQNCLRVDKAAIFCYQDQEKSLTLEQAVGYPAETMARLREQWRFPLGEEGGPVGQVAQTRKPLYLPNLLDAADSTPALPSDPGTPAAPGESVTHQPEQSWTGPEHSLAALGASCYLLPLAYGEHLFGVLGLFSPRAYGFDSFARSLADQFAYYTASALDNARLYQQARQRLTRLTTLREIDRALSSRLSLDEVISVVLENVYPQAGVDAVGVSLMDWKRGRTLLAHLHLPDGSEIEGETFRLSDDLVKQLSTGQETVAIPELPDPRLDDPRGLTRQYSLRSYLGVPLVVGDQSIGVLHLFSAQPYRFSAEEMDFFTTLAGQAAIAIQNARLYETAVQRAESMAFLTESALSIARIGYEGEVARTMVEAAVQVTGATWAGYLAYDERTEEFILVSVYGLSPKQMAEIKDRLRELTTAAPSLSERVKEVFFQERRSIYYPSPSSFPWWKEITSQARSIYLLPVIHGERIFGLLALVSPEEDGFSEEQRALADVFATYAASAMENVRLYRQAQERLRRLSILREIDLGILAARTVKEAVQVVLDKAVTLPGVDAASAMIVQPDGQELEFVASRNLSRKWLLAKQARLGEGVIGTVAASQEPLYIPDLCADPRVRDPHLVREEGIVSYIGVPLVTKTGAVGVLNLYTREQYRPTPDEMDFYATLGGQLGIAIENVSLYQNLQEAYERLRLAQEEAAKTERLRALGQMASGIAHDFNNVLTAILGLTELALRDPTLSPSTREDLERVRSAARGAGDIVARLREFYRQREEREPRQPVDLNELIRQTVNITQPRWKDIPQERGVVIEVVMDLGEVDIIHANPAELREMLINLIFNAVDAMPEGGTLTLRTRQEGQWVVIQVQDTGVGMSEEVKQRLFEPFFTTKGEQGTGLGLAMCYGIVQRHEGKIEVESEPGRGTTFTIRLPLGEAEPQPGEEEEELPPVPPLSVLLIDDDEAVRAVVGRMLRALGHKVDMAADGLEGLEKLHTRHYDLLITDLGMPGISGRDVAREARIHIPQVPIILLTGWGDKMRAEGEIPPEADIVLSKPVTYSGLRRALAQVWESKKQ